MFDGLYHMWCGGGAAARSRTFRSRPGWQFSPRQRQPHMGTTRADADPGSSFARPAFSAYYSRGPITHWSARSPCASRDVPDSVFATMSLPQPQPQPRASPLIPRPVPAPTPRTKSFSLPNALSRVGTPVPKGTWILGRGHDPDDNGYVRTISQALRVLGRRLEPEPPS